MTESVEVLIAHAWTSGGGMDAPPEPEQTWPLCRVLTQSGLAEPDRRSVGIAEVGPFRIAVAPDKAALTRTFLEGGLPAVIRALCQEMTFADAVAEVLLQAFSICSTLAERTVMVRDELAWCALVFLKTQNRNGHEPTFEEITRAVQAARDLTPDEDTIRKVLSDLKHAKPIRGAEELALIEQSGERYRALV